MRQKLDEDKTNRYLVGVIHNLDGSEARPGRG